jgi:hypothetical protein
MKSSLYVETSVISYLTARLATNTEIAGRQVATQRFWEARNQFDLYISPLVEAECSQGDPWAVQQRQNLIKELALLTPQEEIISLADTLIARQAVPAKAAQDAVQIAYAAWYGVEIIVSWNFRHIASVWARRRIEAVLRDLAGC